MFEEPADESPGSGDALYDEAVELARKMQKASISLLQRRLRIGYTRAARLIDLMEERGVIGPQVSGSKPRKVLSADGEAEDDDDVKADETGDDAKADKKDGKAGKADSVGQAKAEKKTDETKAAKSESDTKNK